VRVVLLGTGWTFCKSRSTATVQIDTVSDAITEISEQKLPDSPSAAEAEGWAVHRIFAEQPEASRCTQGIEDVFHRARAVIKDSDEGMSDGEHTWKAIFLHRGTNLNSTSIGIGISNANGDGWLGAFDGDYAVYNGMGLRHDGTSCNQPKRYPGYERNFRDGDVFEFYLRFDGAGMGTLTFAINEVNHGVAWDDIPAENGPYFPSFSFDGPFMSFALLT